MIKNAKIYCAPIQGFTDYVWRNVHAEVFGNVDIYYTPFMRVVDHSIPHRHIADVLPENNVARIRPQILATNLEDASIMVKQLRDLGYTEIDINLGCPHPPIALKKKGSGMLAYPALCKELFVALSEINEVKYSIKMRLGYDAANQWQEILPVMDIISPIEIVVHPRIGKQMYRGEVDMKEFSKLYEACHYPLIYNGDIYSKNEIERLSDSYPRLSGVMIGRALLARPHLLSNHVTNADLMHFHSLLYSQYQNLITGGEHQLLTKMKSLWEYFLPDADKKLRKAIKKCNSISKYNRIVTDIFNSYCLT
ncbi:MAG: tRNA-dihydrouridine synthase [Sodaliphilus sp.]